jgi:type IV pilus assembly protein PilP
MRSRRPLLVIAALLLSACSSAPAPGPAPTSRASFAPAPTAPEVAAESEGRARPGPIDEDAIDGRGAVRDPFEAYRPSPPAPPPEDIPRKAKRYGVEQLKLVALVTGTASPRAMLVDPRGKGWIVTQGEIVGRAEKLGSGADEHLASWRVDRIRNDSVVLVREDPGGAPPATHVISIPQETAVEDD